jgi:twitching motility protein PilT
VNGRFRAHLSKQRTGLALGLRVLARELPRLVTLGIPDALLARLRQASGLVLVTGTAGQGKSTTLAAVVDDLLRETARHVLSIEEPIEYVHASRRGLVDQREVGVHGTRARLFETALRSDVDVLVIGEIADAETARQALLAADGARLVLATLDAPAAASAIERLVDLASDVDEGWARAAVASSLRLVVAQRLVPGADRERLHASTEVLSAPAELGALLREGSAEAELARVAATPSVSVKRA